MAPIPRAQSSTVAAIYRAYEQTNEHYDSLGISVGVAATECDRALWFIFRWCSAPEAVDGKKISIFRTGDMWEDRLVSDLEAIGCEVTGQQDRIRLVSGHVRGKIDGRAMGVPEAPKTEHLCEFKSSNDKAFKDIVAKGCKVSKPLHFAQIQLGMHAFGLTRGLYLVVNKNTNERYAERIEYDLEYSFRLLARLDRIIAADEPPTRLCTKRDDFRGLFCRQAAVCWGRRIATRDMPNLPSQHSRNGRSGALVLRAV
ncbi:oxidoreductase [Agrobacterium sp. lyk4-40-TYG-31]|uniref:oxidoreductase n=1 Tax=Agrobacterium sp. lyk4-40-TYG-31 TaxID=3040276 RepID=UPI00254A19E4|nr:oxidoreductase [Agrobacterium sp. lyk4-40-TYG-31]